MNKPIVKIIFSVAAICGGTLSGALQASAQTAEPMDTPAVGSAHSESFERAPLNEAEAAERAKNQAERRKMHDEDVMRSLINEGDSEAIREVVADLDSRSRPRIAEQTLERCIQPRVIAAVGDFLRLEESAQNINLVDIGVRPKSVEAG